MNGSIDGDFVAEVKRYFLQLQRQVCTSVGGYEPKSKFFEDVWQSQLGEGVSCVLQGGEVIEQAGANFSHVRGESLPKAAVSQREHWQDAAFEALGVSVIVHPKNPHIPTVHFNVRLFVMKPKDQDWVWWFGGGFDLTPYYGVMEDVVDWHQRSKAICDPFEEGLYQELKDNCDDYFFIKHRNEPRGVGGLFFDDFNRFGPQRSFDFIQSVGKGFCDAYSAIVARRKNEAYGEQERAFQKFRRGRYVEFNLVYDRGTAFGLQFGGRIKSILISLPPEVSWRYDFPIEPDSPEQALYDNFLVRKDWLVS